MVIYQSSFGLGLFVPFRAYQARCWVDGRIGVEERQWGGQGRFGMRIYCTFQFWEKNNRIVWLGGMRSWFGRGSSRTMMGYHNSSIVASYPASTGSCLRQKRSLPGSKCVHERGSGTVTMKILGG